jgi:hypothetical protein
MIPPDIANGLALYWAFGVLWLSSGLWLPKPLGWLRHDMPLAFQVLFVIFFGAIWPLVAAKIFYHLLRGDEEFKL